MFEKLLCKHRYKHLCRVDSNTPHSSNIITCGFGCKNCGHIKVESTYYNPKAEKLAKIQTKIEVDKLWQV